MDLDSKQKELSELRKRVEELENELVTEPAETQYWPSNYYTAYYATTGFMLGMFGAMASLLFNVVGAALFGKHPLELIRVYLTFPLGDRALEINSGLTLAIGCCLYLATGMLLGVPFYLVLTRFTRDRSFGARILVATILSLIIWMVNFYAILSWLQPALIDMSPKNLIVNRIPVWVAASTHLVYGWTMVLVYRLGEFTPYRSPMTEHESRSQ